MANYGEPVTVVDSCFQLQRDSQGGKDGSDEGGWTAEEQGYTVMGGAFKSSSVAKKG